ncbi:MAG: hypothetical protein GXP62_09950, partial [Oligoflexia bacterium]|nr:hypothetical protein [Oligoflexia bacterium]
MSGLSFFETMRGELVDQQGHRHSADIEVKAEVSAIKRLARNGRARLSGVASVPPWGQDVAINGTLELSFIRTRRIAYDLYFSDDQGCNYRLHGHKSLGGRHPLRSMTFLPVRLSCADEVLAEGALYFDLRDIPSFASSWSLSTTLRRVSLPGLPSQVLTASETRTLQAYIEVLIEGGGIVAPADEGTIQATAELLAELPPAVRLGYRGLLHALDVAAIGRHGRSFAGLKLDRRRALVASLSDNRPVGRGLSLALGLPIKLSHFGRRDYLDRVGLPTFQAPAAEPLPRWMAGVQTPQQLQPETEIDVDVVVVGSGAGGGPVAALLSERGLSVAVIEAGPYAQRSDYGGPLEDRIRRFWHQGGLSMSVGNVPLLIPTGRVVGGTTTINSGTCYPTPGPVLEEWRTGLGLGDDFAPDAFEPYLQSVLRTIQVEPAQSDHLGDIAAVVAAGADALGATHGPLPRNAPGCDGQGVCVFGCPTGAKQSTDISYIPRALRSGAVVFTGLTATRILMHSGRAVAVEARGQDNNGERRLLRVRARAVVVAAGTLRSPLLLRDSGFSMSWLGRNLSVHPAIGMLARGGVIDEPWRAIPQGYGVDGLLDNRLDSELAKRVRFEGFWVPPQFAALILPLLGHALTDWMGDLRHVGQYGFMVRDPGAGSVRRGPGGHPLIHYNVSRDVLACFRSGAAVLAELLLRGGAEQVFAGVGPVGVVRTVDEARAIAHLELR